MGTSKMVNTVLNGIKKTIETLCRKELIKLQIRIL